jgi:hypothetical protein
MSKKPDHKIPGTSFFRPTISFLVAIVLLLLLDSWVGNQRAAGADAVLRERLLDQTAEIASAINPELARNLSFTERDVGTPAFERLHEQMAFAKASSPKVKWIYTMAVRGGRIVFGPDNLEKSDKEYTPPGDEYKKPPKGL